jgi:hypothetical protein
VTKAGLHAHRGGGPGALAQACWTLPLLDACIDRLPVEGRRSPQVSTRPSPQVYAALTAGLYATLPARPYATLALLDDASIASPSSQVVTLVAH